MAQNTQFANIRIVLLGKTGMGKSAAGNTILGRKAFVVKCSSESVTSKCTAHDATVDGQRVTVIDTPGLYDTSMKAADLKSRIEDLFNHSGEGIHAFLLVIKVGSKFTKEEQNTVQWIRDNFGEEASKNTIVLFTNGYELQNNDQTIDQYITEGEELKKLVKRCNERYHVFNNRDNNDRSQVIELLKMIKEMQKNNSLYTKEKYDKTQRNLLIANVLGAATGGAAGAGVGGGAAAAYGLAKTAVIGSAVVGCAGVAVAAGAVGAGAMVYKYFQQDGSSDEDKKKD